MEEGIPVKVGDYVCPHCKWKLDGAVAAGEGATGKAITPIAGDYCICSRCANWLVYTGESIRAIEVPDIERMSQDIFDCLVKQGLKIYEMNRVRRLLKERLQAK